MQPSIPQKPYTAHIADDTMSPRIKRSYTVYFDPSETVTVGDDAAVYFTDGGYALRNISAQDESSVTLQQFNPMKTERVERTEIRAMHRVGWLRFVDD